jgi:hypothetical protein
MNDINIFICAYTFVGFEEYEMEIKENIYSAKQGRCISQ